MPSSSQFILFGQFSKTREKTMNLLRIIIALFLPPVAVFTTVGLGPTFIINILLTLLGILPGSIHAIWVIVKHEEQVARETGFQ